MEKGKLFLIQTNYIDGAFDVVDSVINKIDNIFNVPVYTTRKQRNNEKETELYKFISQDTFDELKENNDIYVVQSIEAIKLCILKKDILRLLNQGKNLLITVPEEIYEQAIKDDFDVISICLYDINSMKIDDCLNYNKVIVWLPEKNKTIHLLKKYIELILYPTIYNVNDAVKYPFLTEANIKKIENNKPISFVMGPACSSKTYFINHYFNKDKVIIDLLDIQKELDVCNTLVNSTVKSYEVLKHQIIINILMERNTVIEGTFLKSKRRETFIKEIKKISNQDIDIFISYPSIKSYKKYCETRKISWRLSDWDVIEFPLYNEGYDHIYYVDEDGVYSAEDFYVKLHNTDCCYFKKEDMIDTLVQNKDYIGNTINED